MRNPSYLWAAHQRYAGRMGDVPVGTVCLVFTGIQGSTALWERYGDGIQDMLGMHHAVIR